MANNPPTLFLDEILLGEQMVREFGATILRSTSNSVEAFYELERQPPLNESELAASAGKYLLSLGASKTKVPDSYDYKGHTIMVRATSDHTSISYLSLDDFTVAQRLRHRVRC